VVDSNPERAERAITGGMLAVAADSTHDETLRQLGIDRARGLVAALSTDADNLFVLLSAKGLNPKIYVAARAAEEGAEEKMRRAGADAVFAPYSITGHRLAQSLLRPHVVQFLDFTTKDIGMDVSIEQVRVSENSEVASKTIKDMQIGRELGYPQERRGDVVQSPGRHSGARRRLPDRDGAGAEPAGAGNSGDRFPNVTSGHGTSRQDAGVRLYESSRTTACANTMCIRPSPDSSSWSMAIPPRGRSPWVISSRTRSCKPPMVLEVTTS
jgi:Trk K+ transport system NAD-binding subunit